MKEYKWAMLSIASSRKKEKPYKVWVFPNQLRQLSMLHDDVLIEVALYNYKILGHCPFTVLLKEEDLFDTRTKALKGRNSEQVLY